MLSQFINRTKYIHEVTMRDVCIIDERLGRILEADEHLFILAHPNGRDVVTRDCQFQAEHSWVLKVVGFPNLVRHRHHSRSLRCDGRLFVVFKLCNHCVSLCCLCSAIRAKSSTARTSPRALGLTSAATNISSAAAPDPAHLLKAARSVLRR